MPALAQVTTVDPSTVTPPVEASSDLAPVPAEEGAYGTTMPADGAPAQPVPQTGTTTGTTTAGAPTLQTDPAVASGQDTYAQDDVLSAAEGVFGKGAHDLAKLVEKVLKEQGQPSAYIAGREAGGAFAVGVRYGSGTLFHKVEGDQPVFWTGPSLGFDIGASGSKMFVLVYNLYDSAELYHRFPAAEGNLYVVGGFTASYLRRGDIVLIPIRLGVGWRLGANVGYMKFTKESKILPF